MVGMRVGMVQRRLCMSSDEESTKGCIVDDGSGCRVLGVPRLCYHYRCSSASRKKNEAYEL